jgi:hypothetical protein
MPCNDDDNDNDDNDDDDDDDDGVTESAGGRTGCEWSLECSMSATHAARMQPWALLIPLHVSRQQHQPGVAVAWESLGICGHLAHI